MRLLFLFTVSQFHWNLECWFYGKGGKPEDLEKNPGSNEENQQHARFGNQTQALVVRGKPSYHCAIPVRPIMYTSSTFFY